MTNPTTNQDQSTLHQQQRIKLAEFEGWTYEPAGKDSFGVNYNEFWRREHETIIKLPDYLHDADALKRVIGRLDDDSRVEFTIRLVCKLSNASFKENIDTIAFGRKKMFAILVAPNETIIDCLCKVIGRE